MNVQSARISATKNNNTQRTHWKDTGCAVRCVVIFGRTHSVQTVHLIICCPTVYQPWDLFHES